jgi:hypothetical protein
MKILSIRRGFTSDHSSTSYEFLAVDKPLTREAREKVKSLSRRVRPTRRRAHFIYHADGYDIPGGWEPLMREYYDVMYSESYDWWTLAMAFDAPEDQQKEMSQYEFDGVDDLGVRISTHESRVIVTIHCRLEAGAVGYLLGEHYEEDWSEEGEEEEGDQATFETDDALLSLLTEIRKQLVNRDYRALYAVWKVYGCEIEEEEGEDKDEFEPPLAPPKKRAGQKVVDQLREMLDAP